MLRWGGDYTLPRFRAKLAEKNNIDPLVEPNYEEIYRPELGGRTIVRRVGSGMLSASASSGSLRHSSSAPSIHKAQANSTLPQLFHDASLPKLGVRRMDAFSRSRPGPRPQDVPTSPQNDQERKEAEMAMKVRDASKELWRAMNGAEEQIKEQVYRGGPLNAIQPAFVERALKQYPPADLDWRNDEWNGMTLLLKEIRMGHLAVVMWLLERKADHTVVDNSGRGALHWAAFEGQTKIMDYLLKNRPIEVEKNEVVNDPLSFHVQFFQEDWVEKTSYSRGAAVIQTVLNVPDSIAADMSKIEHTVFKADVGGDTPLHLASYAGHLQIVRLLVGAKADAHLKNAGGFTPLDLCVARKHPWPGEETPPPIYRSRPKRDAPPGRKPQVTRYLREKTDVEADMEEPSEEDQAKGLARYWRPCDQVRIAQIAEEARDPWGVDPQPVPDPARDCDIRKEVQDRLKAHVVDVVARRVKDGDYEYDYLFPKERDKK